MISAVGFVAGTTYIDTKHLSMSMIYQQEVPVHGSLMVKVNSLRIQALLADLIRQVHKFKSSHTHTILYDNVSNAKSSLNEHFL